MAEYIFQSVSVRSDFTWSLDGPRHTRLGDEGHFFVWQSFLIHTLLVTYVLMQLVAREIVPNFRNLWMVGCFLLIITPILKGVNGIWKTNFFFLERPVVGSSLEFLYQVLGNFYLLGLIFLVLIFWVILYLPWRLAQKKEKTVV